MSVSPACIIFAVIVTSAPETSSAQEPPVEVIASENIETKSEGIDANDVEKRSGWWRR